MYIEKMNQEKFNPFKIIIETQEEAEYFLYHLCQIPCPADPKGIESKMRQIILDELKRQNKIKGT